MRMFVFFPKQYIIITLIAINPFISTGASTPNITNQSGFIKNCIVQLKTQIEGRLYNLNAATFSNQSEVTVSVNWPNFSTENKVEIYDAMSTLVTTICDPANCYSGSTDNSYSTTVNLGCLTDGETYTARIFDNEDDGWDGSANITITGGSTTLLTNNGGSANTAGVNLNFTIAGGGAACAPSNVFSGKVFVDTDGSQTITGAEVGQNGVTVELFEDTDMSGTVTTGDVSVGTQVTAIDGDYSFDLNLTYSGTVTAVIEDGEDDARDGNSSEDRLQIGKDKDIGLRFTGITIPSNATITNAYLYLTPDASDNKSGSVQIYGENVPSPVDYDPNDDVDGRSRTSASEDWTFSNWVENVEEQTSDITLVINELITNNGTYTNGIMNFVMISDGDDNLDAKSYETNNDGTEVPRLVINYTVPSNYKYVAEIDETTLPVGGSITTDNVEVATFTASGQNDTGNNFGISLCGPTIIQKNQSVCNDNGTISGADDYFTITVSGTDNAGNGTQKYEIVYNGTVLNPGGTDYGQAFIIGNGQ